MQRQVAHGLTFGFSYSYIDAYTRKSLLKQAGLPATAVPTGSPLPGSAKKQLLGLHYERPLGTSSVAFRVDTSYKGPSQSNFVDLMNFDNDNFVRYSSMMVWGGSIT